MIDLILLVLISVLGLALHIAMKWEAARHAWQTGVGDILTPPPAPGIRAYLKKHPAATTVAILGAIVSFLVCYMLGWLNPGSALACGYMANSLTQQIAQRFAPGPA